MKKLAVLFSVVCGLAACASFLAPAAGADVTNNRCQFPDDISAASKGNPNQPSSFPSGPFAVGQAFLKITNVNNPTKSITVNASGPVFLTDDGYLFRGSSLLALTPAATGIFQARGCSSRTDPSS